MDISSEGLLRIRLNEFLIDILIDVKKCSVFWLAANISILLSERSLGSRPLRREDIPRSLIELIISFHATIRVVWVRGAEERWSDVSGVIVGDWGRAVDSVTVLLEGLENIEPERTVR